MMNHKPYTSHEDVNSILQTLLTDVKSVLKDQFIGMYLFGSLANGNFDIASDVDVLIVTKDEVSPALFSALYSMHENITALDSPWANQLEVSYISQNALRHFDPANNIHPHHDRGEGEKLHPMLHANDWIIQRHILYERGVTVEGPNLLTLIDPVTPNDLKWAVIDVLPLWTELLLKDPVQEIRPRGYQSYIVLSLCRMLYTIQNGGILSKIAAAEWALKTLEEKWAPLIERAILGRQSPRMEIEAGDVVKTLDFIHHTMDQCEQFKKLNSSPTRYSDVNEVLNLLHSSAKEVLGNQFIGMYLYGSLSSGDFNPESSDIDFAIITEGSLAPKDIFALEAMHNRIKSIGLKWASKLEGAYLPKELIRRHDPNGLECPNINEGRFIVSQLGSDWIIQRHVIREYGVLLEGPDPKTLIDFVSADEIRQSIFGVLQEWWFPMLNDPSWLRDHQRGDRAFAVITMCRALHAIEHGAIVSKPKAIQWARIKFNDPWVQLINRAVAVSQHHEHDLLLNDVMDFIRFTKENINQFNVRK